MTPRTKGMKWAYCNICGIEIPLEQFGGEVFLHDEDGNCQYHMVVCKKHFNTVKGLWRAGILNAMIGRMAIFETMVRAMEREKYEND